jgi:hypothetical protein
MVVDVDHCAIVTTLQTARAAVAAFTQRSFASPLGG